MIPSLTGGAGAAAFLLTGGEGSDEQPGNSIFWRLGLELHWSVLDGGYFIANMNQAKAEFLSLQWQRDNQAAALEQDIRSTAAVAMKSFAIIELAEKRLAAAQENYALVNEAYIKLVDQTRVNWEGRTHFFAVAAQAMGLDSGGHLCSASDRDRAGNPPSLEQPQALSARSITGIP